MAYNYEYPYTDPDQYNDDWLINKVKQLSREWDEMKIKFNTLEEYVKNYFANLNLQDKVNEKIDQMIADGTFTNIITNKLNPSPYAGPAVVLSGNFSVKSAVGGLSLAGYCAALIGCTVTDLSQEGYSLLTPGYTYYAKFQSLPSDKDVRYCFVMLEETDYQYGLTNIQNALSSLGNLVRGKNAQLYVIPKPLPTTTATLDQITHYYWYSQLAQNTFRVVKDIWIPGYRAIEWIVNGIMDSGDGIAYAQKIASLFDVPFNLEKSANEIRIEGLNVTMVINFISGYYLGGIFNITLIVKTDDITLPKMPIKVNNFIVNMISRENTQLSLHYQKETDTLALSGTPLPRTYTGVCFIPYL